ncbi:transmembrane domain-containing protein DDB_G0287209-like, partial [Orbicella faveolata]|uniref:transmembrane domain-containing protein DDB_G0287209-like n=1 Tax=Orbicella faveolata TaxID=48498 RepID=UPI0009E442FB
ANAIANANANTSAIANANANTNANAIGNAYANANANTNTIAKAYANAYAIANANANANDNAKGITLASEYTPKDGQCQAVCCDGAGGALTVERKCTPTDKCKGIEPDEKEEDGHCPKESKGTCSDICDDEGELYRFVCLPRYRVTVGGVIVQIS